jgi:cation transport ATPase
MTGDGVNDAAAFAAASIAVRFPSAEPTGS